MSIMSPKGLVPAILASIPIQMGITGGEEIQSLAYAVVLLSILICGILVIILSNDPLAIGYLKNILGQKESENEDSESTSDLVKPMNLDSKTTEEE